MNVGYPLARKLARTGTALAWALALAGPRNAQAAYVVHDLGTLGGTRSVATEINELGQVAGFATNPSATNRPFLLTPSGGLWALDVDMDGANDLMLDLGTLDPANPPTSGGVA